MNALLKLGGPPFLIVLIRQLQAVLSGSRDPALAADPQLDFMNSAELTLLLDSLEQGA